MFYTLLYVCMYYAGNLVYTLAIMLILNAFKVTYHSVLNLFSIYTVVGCVSVSSFVVCDSFSTPTETIQIKENKDYWTRSAVQWLEYLYKHVTVRLHEAVVVSQCVTSVFDLYCRMMCLSIVCRCVIVYTDRNYPN